MSLLEKILGDEKTQTKKPEPEKKRDDKNTSQQNKRPAEIPSPCLECWSPTYWRSIYGGELRCAVCDPWPATSMRGEQWAVVKNVSGEWSWEPDLPEERDVGQRDEAVAVSGGSQEWTVVETTDEQGDWITLKRL